MAKNELIKFASGDRPNLVPFREWETNNAVQKGFVAGIAKSAELNRVWAQGALASYVLGEFVKDQTQQNVTLETDLYTAFKNALTSYTRGNIADHSINEQKLASEINASRFVLTIKQLATNERTRYTYRTGELVYDTNENKVYVGDGRTQGGARLSSGGGVPVGTVGQFFTKTVPEGWLLCNGASVSRTTYRDLFEAIGTTYGAGDGSTTFNLPNVDGRFLESTTSLTSVGQKVEAGLPNITGRVSLGHKDTGWYGCVHNASGCFSASDLTRGSVANNDGDNYKTLSFSANNSSRVFGNAETVQPKSLKVLVCIKF